MITGVTGQDGAYLSEFLLEKGYEVHGVKRRTSLFNTHRIDALFEREGPGPRLLLHHGDMTDSSSLLRIIQEVQPDEIYNLGAQSHVKVSFEQPEYSADTDALGTLRILEAMRILGLADSTRFYQASTSELFGRVQEVPQTEKTPFYPRSPYGVAKLYAYWIVTNYREAYGIFGCNGILFNHESPLRGETFVTRKITRAVARIALGFQQKLTLGNLDALRDWGHARDFVEGMWLMLQHHEADDFVLATGEQHSVREFAQLSFSYAGIQIEWSGSGPQEKGIDTKTGKVVVEIDPKYYRPTEVDTLLGDATKAKNVLGWKPTVGFDELVREMVEADLHDARRDHLVKESGFNHYASFSERH